MQVWYFIFLSIMLTLNTSYAAVAFKASFLTDGEQTGDAIIFVAHFTITCLLGLAIFIQVPKIIKIIKVSKS